MAPSAALASACTSFAVVANDSIVPSTPDPWLVGGSHNLGSFVATGTTASG